MTFDLPHLLRGGRTVVHEDERGEDVRGEADDSDEVWGDPGWDSCYQPLPVPLHQRLQQRTTSTAVPAGLHTHIMEALGQLFFSLTYMHVC